MVHVDKINKNKHLIKPNTALRPQVIKP